MAGQAERGMEARLVALKKQQGEREACIRQETGLQVLHLRKELAEAAAQLHAVEQYSHQREALEGELHTARAEIARLQTVLDKEVWKHYCTASRVIELGRFVDSLGRVCFVGAGDCWIKLSSAEHRKCV